MSKGKIKAVLFFVLFLLVVALVCSLLIELQDEKAGLDEAIDLPMATATPAQVLEPTSVPKSVPTAVPAPMPTATPVPTPQPTPESTPEPTPESIPVGTVLGSGQFLSETGVELNVRAAWTAETIDESHAKVSVEVYLDSYSLQIREAYGSVLVSVGDSYKKGNSPEVDWDKNVKISTLLCTTEHIVELYPGENKTYPVQVVYNFDGVYMKQELPTIECGGAITLSR